MTHPDSFLDQESKKLEIGDTVIIAENDHLLDCCQGKRGRIAHMGVGGGWLICTDHFCPIERTEEELTLVPRSQLAREKIEATNPQVVESYMRANSDILHDSMGRGDVLAWAVLLERGEVE